MFAIDLIYKKKTPRPVKLQEHNINAFTFINSVYNSHNYFS